jgi:hypothetical protein
MILKVLRLQQNSNMSCVIQRPSLVSVSPLKAFPEYYNINTILSTVLSVNPQHPEINQSQAFTQNPVFPKDPVSPRTHSHSHSNLPIKHPQALPTWNCKIRIPTIVYNTILGAIRTPYDLARPSHLLCIRLFICKDPNSARPIRLAAT